MTNHLFLGNFVSDQYILEMMRKHLIKIFHVEHENSKSRLVEEESFRKYFDNPKKLSQIKNKFLFRIKYSRPNSNCAKRGQK